MQISKFISQFRSVKEKTGLTNREIGRAIGISEQSVGSILMGNAKAVSDTTAEKILFWLKLNGETIADHYVGLSHDPAHTKLLESSAQNGLATIPLKDLIAQVANHLGVEPEALFMDVLAFAQKNGKK